MIYGTSRLTDRREEGFGARQKGDSNRERGVIDNILRFLLKPSSISPFLPSVYPACDPE
jgi:hypothetical protein